MPSASSPQFVTHFGMLPQQRGQVSPELLYELCLRHISRYPYKAMSSYTRAPHIIVPMPLQSGKAGQACYSFDGGAGEMIVRLALKKQGTAAV